MLVRALLQTSLVLWLAQQTLQGGVRPQSVSWGRVLPARGVGVGVKPVAGALGALGNRYGTKAMKTGIGRYPGAQLGLGGYRSLGLGGAAGLKQGGYGAQGAYGAALGTGLTNGLGLGLRGKFYGAGLGALPGYGALGAVGHPGARPGAALGFSTGQKQQKPGVSAADLGGPQMANLGQAAEDAKREKSRALGPMAPLDKQSKGLGVAPSQGGESYHAAVLERSHGALGRRQLLPLDRDVIRSLGSSQSVRDYDPSSQNNQRANCGSRPDLSHVLGISPHDFLGSEAHRTHGAELQPRVDKDGKHTGRVSPHGEGERAFQPPRPQDGHRSYLSAAADGQRVKDLTAKDKSGPRIRGTVAVENPGHGSVGGVSPGGSQTLGLVEGKEAKSFTADGQKVKELTGRNDQATSYVGGAGNYLGAGGYGAGLGQGAYLGGAAGKLGGYGDGATGYLGAMGGNGFGYGNGYGDALGGGLGHPSELADGAENKAGKREALSTGSYAAPVQGAYGALGAGLDPTGGKYAGAAAQLPYGNAPVIPTGLEGDGGYPYPAQQLNLGAEGAKTANKYGAAAGYGPQQTGYGAQLGATQDALAEQPGKYGGVNGGNGYKG